MARSSKKGSYVDWNLVHKVEAVKRLGEKRGIKTWARSCTIIPDFIGLTFLVHNGRKFLPVYITEQMVGHKLGEFSFTRFFRGHGEAHTKEASAKT